MSDFILYFGPLELAALLMGLLVSTVLIIFIISQRRRRQEFRRILDGFSYPAMLLRRGQIIYANGEAQERRKKQEFEEIIREASRAEESTVRTSTTEEGHVIQVHMIRLSNAESLLILEDYDLAQKQHAFYRNFIQNVSHELKTPLTIIQGHAAKMGDAPDDRQGWLASCRIISDETKRLTQLVDNLLTLARLESPAFGLECAPLNFGSLLEEAILDISELAEERQIALSLNLPAGLPRINADRARLKQAVLNLLDNALKYTPPGGEVIVNLDNDPEKLHLVCSIRDSGEGIAQEDLPNIFEKLYRAQRIKRRPVEGSGLGLTLVQQIVEAHGGEIRVQSEVDRGSTFTFTIPYEAHRPSP